MHNITPARLRVLKACSKRGHKAEGAEKRVASGLVAIGLLTVADGIYRITQAGHQHIEWETVPGTASRHAGEQYAKVLAEAISQKRESH